MSEVRPTILVGAMLALCTLSGPIAALALAPPASGTAPVLVIAPGSENIVARAGGRSVFPVRALFGTLAQGDAGFATRAKAAGAWHVSDAAWLAALCSSEFSE